MVVAEDLRALRMAEDSCVDADLPDCNCDVTRVKKLKETLVAVQQLDKNMSSLRTWLAHIESELAKPIVYDSCDSEEIQRKLNEQQELQRDIEKHSTGVASVLNLCEVLLHDCDACATDAECDSIQQATRNLDRRWRNICAMSMERRLKIEETWRLWQKFLDDYSRFEDWLKISERTAALPRSSGVIYIVAKEELKTFEAFQRQVHECLTQLELINKQYRRLARENRTDSACSLRQMVHEGNQRWDNLQKRVTSILRRLKHFIGQREEFETARDSILVWLTEMDLQLTNIEHFSECDVQAKIKQLKAFQQEISLNHNKIEQIIAQGEQLIEKSEPLDAAVIEEELDELRRYCQEVFGRVERYHKKLIRLPLPDDEHDLSDRELELEDSAALSDLHWHDRSADSVLSPQPSSNPSLSLAQPLRSERSGRDTPASVDSIPLEWDHDYDLSRDLESAVSRTLPSEDEEGQEDKDFYLRGAVGLSDVTIPESPEAYVKLTENAIKSTSGDHSALESHMRQLGKALDDSQFQMQQTENIIRSKTPTGPELDTSYKGYMTTAEMPSGIIFFQLLFKVRHQGMFKGFRKPHLWRTPHHHCVHVLAGVIDRWELIQAQALSKELRMKQNLQKWQQFNADLNNIWAWLGDTEEELERLRCLELSTDIQTIERQIQKLKELQKAVDHRKAIILSINLCSPEFTQADSEESRDLQDRLSRMNGRWDRVCCLLEEWRGLLQHALMQCQDFHEMSHGLLLMLENIDRRKNEIVPVDSNLDVEIHQDHHRQLMVRCTLWQLQLFLAGLWSGKYMARYRAPRSWDRELLKESSPTPASGRSTPNRQKTPRGKCSLSQPGPSVSSPHSRSTNGGSDSSLSEPRPARSGRAFLLRVLRAAIPLQLLLLLLIGLACLVPMSEEDYSCALSNNFARSFHPMLRYTNGPPPL
uniref:Spectrin repeat containing nuclear envelope protein 1 n=1 Tax=Prolemur simus TaxID=1328070 RepID=A0A8C9AA15_PROSS